MERSFKKLIMIIAPIIFMSQLSYGASKPYSDTSLNCPIGLQTHYLSSFTESMHGQQDLLLPWPIPVDAQTAYRIFTDNNFHNSRCSGYDTFAITGFRYLNYQLGTGQVPLRIEFNCYRTKYSSGEYSKREVSTQLCRDASRCLSYLATQDPYQFWDASESVILLARAASFMMQTSCLSAAR